MTWCPAGTGGEGLALPGLEGATQAPRSRAGEVLSLPAFAAALCAESCRLWEGASSPLDAVHSCRAEGTWFLHFYAYIFFILDIFKQKKVVEVFTCWRNKVWGEEEFHLGETPWYLILWGGRVQLRLMQCGPSQCLF